jgi:hypothetical protein
VPRTPDPKAHALWRERIRRQVQSGLSIVQFCAQEGLRAKSFYAWKRRLQRVELAGPRTALPAPAAFLPITVRLAEPTTHEPPPIEADLPNGIRLRILTANGTLGCRLVRVLAGARTGSLRPSGCSSTRRPPISVKASMRCPAC